MGISWRAMPLLSTLAALVIIVHSAEEHHDRDYRYELRPRALDTGTPSYEQPWRSIEADPMIRQSTQLDAWQDSPEEPHKRRRPTRKRKRRPTTSSEELPTLDRHMDSDAPEVIRLYPETSDEKPTVREEPARFHETEEPLRYRDTEYAEQTTEMPRRRRKRPENRRNRWAEEYLDIERPQRRRGQRRKRPSVETWPRLSEFDEYRQNEESHEMNKSGQDEKFQGKYDHISADESQQSNKDFSNKPQTEATDVAETKVTEPMEEYLQTSPRDNYQMKEDKSLSEFSMEMIAPVKQTEGLDLDTQERAHGKSLSNKKRKQKLENQPIDPMKLKEILKRSNGTSLSEILQQRNLSLTDLLNGKEDAISLLKSEGLIGKDDGSIPNKSSKPLEAADTQVNIEGRHFQTEFSLPTEVVTENNESIQNTEATIEKDRDLQSQSTGRETTPQNEVKENAPKISTRRRLQGVRRKLRIRPAINNNYKAQLNRDLMALTARKYQHSRNATKSKEWKYVIPLMNGTDRSEEAKEELQRIVEVITTTTSVPEETTILQHSEYNNPATVTIETQTEVIIEDTESDIETTETTETTQTPLTTTQETTTSEITTTTEKSMLSRLRPSANCMGLRRQAFDNRLKRKRMKQKNSTTEPPAERDNLELDFFGMPNLVSSSEFIARTQTPKPANPDKQEEDYTTLTDFMTTEKSRHLESGPRFTRNSTIPQGEIEPKKDKSTPRFTSTTEETAKFEIEEILNDTRTSARLSRILMERNMTLNELVEHRERGSSHVHLADIFHNASKEPNPPEPFLSKSSIEPISKETYPLRALLEANLHDPKATTMDPTQTQYINIPVVMDFGNNVNENGENMGIMSLFSKFSENDITGVEKSEIGKDSEGTPYVTTVIAVNNTANETSREGRLLKPEETNLKHDVLGWSELFELMRRNQDNETEHEIPHLEDTSLGTKVLIPDRDGDGLIVLEDLQQLNNVGGVNLASVSEEKQNLNSYEKAEVPVQPGILDKAPSHTRSVTVATASIVGLALVLFLLTYAAFKWKQQRSLLRKKQSFSEERIPTPVFEHRKGHKNNCSTRSISPMLATSNIYTMSTLDSNTGKESPDYMWDSLRKPFQ